jgi:hypothetical protein
MRLLLPLPATVVLIALASPVAARTLVSPAIEGGGPTEGFVCYVLNAGKKPLRQATGEVRESGGVALSTSVPLEGLAPGEVAKIATLASGTPRTVYCAVEGKVSAKSVKITLCISASPLYDCVTGP